MAASQIKAMLGLFYRFRGILTLSKHAFTSKDILNIITPTYSQGLLNTTKMISNVINDLGNHNIIVTDFYKKKLFPKKLKINIHLERINSFFLKQADINIFVPNPEWVLDNWEKLEDRIDSVMCKTRDTERIFSDLNANTFYTSFTSIDRYLKTDNKVREFVHIAGSSEAKGTRAVIDVWNENPELPKLHLYNFKNPMHEYIHTDNIDYHFGKIDENELEQIFNTYYFHLCPSEYEGFGHNINEAKSTGAVIITTDAPPMNTLITDDFGFLVKYEKKEPFRFASAYKVDRNDLLSTVKKVLELSDSEMKNMSEKCRESYLKNELYFKERLTHLIENVEEIQTRNTTA